MEILNFPHQGELPPASLNVVVPLWNESAILPELHRRLSAACSRSGMEFRIIYVDDGSSDDTPRLLADIAAKDDRTGVVVLSRNFGQPAAIAAGMRETTGDVVILMDGDLQDPPELIPDLVSRWQESDCELVIARRTAIEESGLARRLLFKTFHRFFSGLSDVPVPAHTGTFCLMTRKVVESILELPESHRFFPGLRAWVGYKTAYVEYARPERPGGELPRQTFSRLVKYAGDAVFGFSARPVVWILYASVLSGLFGMGCLAGASLNLVRGGSGLATATGFVISAMAFGMGVQLLATCYVAELVRRTHEQSKGRPLFNVASRLNCHPERSSISASGNKYRKSA